VRERDDKITQSASLNPVPTKLPAVDYPRESEEYVFSGVGLCVCMCVCLSVTTITKQIVNGFAPNFTRRFLGGKGRPNSCFVTIGIEGCGSNGEKTP